MTYAEAKKAATKKTPTSHSLVMLVTDARLIFFCAWRCRQIWILTITQMEEDCMIMKRQDNTPDAPPALGVQDAKMSM